jgi:hypothetical protein
MLLNLFGSQSRFTTSNIEETETEKPVEIPVASSDIGSRYPKRKREHVTYDEVDEDEFLLDVEEKEEDYEPKKKVGSYFLQCILSCCSH